MKTIWSQPLRVETPNNIVHITARTANSALWFVNNPQLEERIYAFLAKYIEQYEVKLYAFTLIGNHYHLLAKFPESNMASFQRDFNARIAESVRILVKGFKGGHLFSRRYASQILDQDDTIEHYFLYTFLQPVTSKLTARVSDYPGKSFLNDAASGRENKFRYFAYRDYYKAKIKNKRAQRSDFWREYWLRFERLPFYAHLSEGAYKAKIKKIAEDKRLYLIEEHSRKKDKETVRYLTKAELRKIKPGSYPKGTKKGGRTPLVICFNHMAKKLLLEWYFLTYSAFRDAVESYKKGDFSISFPPGTYSPPGLAPS